MAIPTRTATRLTREIDRAGGLMGIADLADAWGVSRQGVHKMVRREDFPAPVATVCARPVWTRRDTDDWRAQHPAART